MTKIGMFLFACLIVLVAGPVYACDPPALQLRRTYQPQLQLQLQADPCPTFQAADAYSAMLRATGGYGGLAAVERTTTRRRLLPFRGTVTTTRRLALPVYP